MHVAAANPQALDAAGIDADVIAREKGVLAEKAMKTSPDTDGRLAFVFRRVLGRRPTDYDMTTLRRMHERQLAAYRADADAAKQLVSVGESPRDASLDLAEHAGLSSVCLGIFNLDEALTRE
jgi:translation elongation factor EF-Ts